MFLKPLDKCMVLNSSYFLIKTCCGYSEGLYETLSSLSTQRVTGFSSHLSMYPSTLIEKLLRDILRKS